MGWYHQVFAVVVLKKLTLRVSENALIFRQGEVDEEVSHSNE